MVTLFVCNSEVIELFFNCFFFFSVQRIIIIIIICMYRVNLDNVFLRRKHQLETVYYRLFLCVAPTFTLAASAFFVLTTFVQNAGLYVVDCGGGRLLVQWARSFSHNILYSVWTVFDCSSSSSNVHDLYIYFLLLIIIIIRKTKNFNR